MATRKSAVIRKGDRRPLYQRTAEALAQVMASVPEGACLPSEPSLRNYPLLPSVRGDLLVKLGRLDEARGEFERAASLTHNTRERELLLARAIGCAQGPLPL